MGVVTADAAAAIPTVLRAPWRSVLVLASFATLLTIVGPRHEPWFDEAQAWLIGRDSSLWELLAHRVRYEGTPGLWHALLWLSSHAGLPYRYLWLISGALACIGAWTILTRAPFPYWLRVGTVFSYFVAYQYAIVARSYALDLALIPLIAASFADRLRRPVVYGVLLGLIANANAHSFLLAGVLFVELLLAIWQAQTEQPSRWRPWRWPRAQLAGIAIYLALAGAAALQAWPPADASYLSTVQAASGRGVQMMFEAFIDRADIWSGAPPSELSQRAGFVLTAMLLAPSLALFQRARVAVLVLALFAALIGFSILQFAHAWHAGVLYLAWILALWIGWSALPQLDEMRRRVTLGSVGAIVFINVYYAATASLRDIRAPYSAASAAAQMLAGGDARIAAIGFKTFAVQPWFPVNAFRNYHDGAPGAAYYVWKLGEDFLPYVAFGRWRHAATDNRYNALLLSTHKVKPDDMPHFVGAALGAGYCGPTELPGGLIWKSYVMESDDLLVFRRCRDGLARVGAEQTEGRGAR
jgi:hypothetical protein